MAKQAKASTSARHLDEAYQLAQMLSSGQGQAAGLLKRAVQGTATGLQDRFALLSAVIDASDIDLMPVLARFTTALPEPESDLLPPLSPLHPLGTSARAPAERTIEVAPRSEPLSEEAPGQPETEAPTEGMDVGSVSDTTASMRTEGAIAQSETEAPGGPTHSEALDAETAGAIQVLPSGPAETTGDLPGSLFPAAATDPLMLRAGRSIRDRLLLIALAAAPPAERALIYLTVRSRGSASDVASIIGGPTAVVAPALKQLLAELDQRASLLSSPTEKALFGAAQHDDAVPEALSRTVDAILEPTPVGLSASLLKPVASKRVAATRPRRPRYSRVLVAMSLVFAVAIMGLLLDQLAAPSSPHPPVNVDLLERVLLESDDIEPGFRAQNPEQIERYLLDLSGRRLTVPDIGEASLTGVGESSLYDRLDVPVLLFEDRTNDTTIPVFAFTYAMLESASGVLQLEPAILAHIQNEGFRDVHDEGPRKAVVFRNRDDIYIAVTTGDVQRLSERIRFPS